MEFDKVKSNRGKVINDLLLCIPNAFSDSRGVFFESWNKNIFDKVVGKNINFVQDNQSSSVKGVLRGLHYQLDPYPQGKLVRCINGEIFDIAVDIRKKSATFGEWSGVYLNDSNKKQFWIPEGFAHGFLTMSSSAIVLYKTTNYWEKDLERSILWNDQSIGIDWPLSFLNKKNPLLSKKDTMALDFETIIRKSEVF